MTCFDWILLGTIVCVGLVAFYGIETALRNWTATTIDLDSCICGLCFKPGAKTPPTPVRWPGQRNPHSKYVHYECQCAEVSRACEALTPEERRDFLHRE